MSLKVCCILLLACIVAIQAADPPKKDTATDARIFLSTFTVILSTVTSTTTIGSTTTCTTSTAALNTCSAGRRRRGLFYDEAENQGRARRGLFYNDDEPEAISAPVKRAAEPAEPASKVTTDESKSVPLVVQSGFSLPEGFVTPSGTPRFKLAYGTSTITTTATSVSTRSLTATCASTTSFSLCATSGK
ncbi:uncharacterized protein LOC130691945 [Daphnia carinata]|uniref:uncharacterized protein LOC130691945 n=1 Tax=Daphnia carinata TaxID=120202 RepID=UPI00257ACCBE|nr:uncharacterized protein LOC130691945 [Daphnia carinata]